MMVSVIVLAKQMGIRYVDPHDFDRLSRDGEPVSAGYDQHPVISQIARAVFNDFSPGFYFVVTVTGIILVLAANTAFNGFPVLGSILAKDGYAPRALGSRGDRLAYSNGIVFLAVMAIILILAFDAQTTRLIQLYIVGVFVSFNLSQLGMIRHWTRHLKTEKDPAVRRRMFRSRMINAIGLVLHRGGAGHRAGHQVPGRRLDHDPGDDLLLRGDAGDPPPLRQRRLELAADDEDKIMPTRVHAIVLVSKLHKPTLRALAFAKATRPNVLEAVYVSTNADDTNRLLEEWDQRRIDVPLKVLHSPYRELIRPIVEYATEIKQANPRGVVAVYIPEYVVGRWWEQLLHNQTALRLKGRLLFTPGVMVTSVPFQLRSSEIARERELREEFRVRPGDLRRGEVDERHDAPTGPGDGAEGTRPARARSKKPRGRSRVGERYDVEVGPVAHGGHCVARVPTGDPTERATRVVFVRHSLPGERVVLEITEGTDGDRFWRADAVEVLDAVARPGVAALPLRRPRPLRWLRLPARRPGPQRALKADVVREQLSRLAGLEVDVTVEAVPGDDHGLRWRTRQRYVELPGGRRGMRKHRSHEVVEVDDCLIAGAPADPRGARSARSRWPPTGSGRCTRAHPRCWSTPCWTCLAPRAGGVRRSTSTRASASSRASCPRRSARPARSSSSRATADACVHAGVNVPGAEVLTGDVGAVLTGIRAGPVDLVVLDPPREGARREVVEAVAARRPRAVAYVACDPAALARDVAIFAEHGYRLERLRAFDLFPMTHHVECVALLGRTE